MNLEPPPRIPSRVVAWTVALTPFLLRCYPAPAQLVFHYETTPLLCELLAEEAPPCQPGEFGCQGVLCETATQAGCDLGPSMHVHRTYAGGSAAAYCESIGSGLFFEAPSCASDSSTVYPVCISYYHEGGGCD